MGVAPAPDDPWSTPATPAEVKIPESPGLARGFWLREGLTGRGQVQFDVCLSVFFEGTGNEILSSEFRDDAGIYIVQHANAAVTAEADKSSEDVGVLPLGDVVKVLEVKILEADDRARGRIEKPFPGWISLRKLSTGYRWASSPDTQIGLFAALTQGFDISNPALAIPASHKHLKMAFDGCGVTNGVTGLVFGTGLDEQCAEVSRRVKQLLSRIGRVRVNAVGLSRGGIACIFLCQMLAGMERAHLNVLLFDPVPGNPRTMVARMDPFGWTNAARSLDMTQCKNLKRVLAIYPHEPLPDFTLHSPIMPRYPDECEVEEDATLGCHQGALACLQRLPACMLAFRRIRLWLADCGTALRPCPQMEVEGRLILRACEEALGRDAPTTRLAHSLDTAGITRHAAGTWLNRDHRRLALASGRGPWPGTDEKGDQSLMLVAYHLISL